MNKKIKFILISILSVLLLTGCSDLVEVQNRAFVLAMGVSVSDGQYEIIFANPEYGKDTKEKGNDSEKRIHSYKSSYLNGIEEKYNISSDKRLDYRHLEVIIFDKSIAEDADMLLRFTEYIKGNYEFSRNVILYYYSGDASDIFEMDKKTGKSIGDYLKMLSDNNQKRNNLKPITIGNLMTGLSQGKTVVVPKIEITEDTVKTNGGAVFYNKICEKELSEDELVLFHIAKGEGKEYVIHAKEGESVLIKKVKSRILFEYTGDNPKIYIKLNVEAEYTESDREIPNKRIKDEEISTYLAEYLESSIEQLVVFYMKEKNIDLLSLYDKSAVSNKAFWIDYNERYEDFINDVKVIVSTVVKMK